MQQMLGRGGFATVSLVQLPVGGWAASKSCPETPDNQRPMTLDQLLLEAAGKDHVANILWAPSTQIDAQQGAISCDMEPADRLTLGEYIQN